MSLITFGGGVNQREPTTIGDDQLQDCDGAEYRVGQQGLYVARGRDQIGDLGSATGRALYAAGFDGTSEFLIAQAGLSLFSSPITASLSFTYFAGLPVGATSIVGTHYANRHYLAAGVANVKLESSGAGVTAIPIGMSRSTFGIGISLTDGIGDFLVPDGLVYWVTEYDSVRGIESMAGVSVSTGAFEDLDGVVVVVTGVSANPRANQLRWYRSTDGGGFPDGGLIETTAIGVTTITDTLTDVTSLTVPPYSLITIGGIDDERDAPPPAMHTILGPFQDSLLGVENAEPRVLRFTPAGFPDSWPPLYAIPLETHRQDEIVTGVMLGGRVGIFTKDSVHVIYRLPRDSDSIFAAGETMDLITDARGCISRRGAVAFTPIGGSPLVAWVARDGIWMADLAATSPVLLTGGIDWAGQVDIPSLVDCTLEDDSTNLRLVFVHRREADTVNNTGVWYLDYQAYESKGIRITFANHGPLVDAVSVAWVNGLRQLVTLDARSDNGQVYVEGTQDVDDSLLQDSDGSVHFLARTKEFLPAGARMHTQLGRTTWMHDAGPARIQHRFFFDRNDNYPEIKVMPDSLIRTASDIMLARSVNSFSLEIQSTGTTSYGIHWADIEGFDTPDSGAAKGA